MPVRMNWLAEGDLLVLFARHAHAISNARRTELGAEAEITEIGSQQRDLLVPVFKRFGIQVVYSSYAMRARQTAEAVAEHCPSIKLIFDDHFNEKRHAVIVEGKHRNDPEVERHHRNSLLLPLLGKKYDSGEETTEERHQCAVEIERMFLEGPYNRIAVVSHYNRMNDWDAFALERGVNELTVDINRAPGHDIANTGTNLYRFAPPTFYPQEQKQWHQVFRNNFAHLDSHPELITGMGNHC